MLIIQLYFIKYDYKPTIANSFGNNKYLANESCQIGAAAFHTSKTTVSFKVTYEARFGAATDNAASPWCIYLDYVRANKVSKEYSFTL